MFSNVSHYNTKVQQRLIANVNEVRASYDVTPIYPCVPQSLWHPVDESNETFRTSTKRKATTAAKLSRSFHASCERTLNIKQENERWRESEWVRESERTENRVRDISDKNCELPCVEHTTTPPLKHVSIGMPRKQFIAKIHVEVNARCRGTIASDGKNDTEKEETELPHTRLQIPMQQLVVLGEKAFLR